MLLFSVESKFSHEGDPENDQSSF